MASMPRSIHQLHVGDVTESQEFEISYTIFSIDYDNEIIKEKNNRDTSETFGSFADWLMASRSYKYNPIVKKFRKYAERLKLV
jgi:hypothetical protein